MACSLLFQDAPPPPPEASADAASDSKKPWERQQGAAVTNGNSGNGNKTANGSESPRTARRWDKNLRHIDLNSGCTFPH